MHVSKAAFLLCCSAQLAFALSSAELQSGPQAATAAPWRVAQQQPSRCRITDPTGTPLNIRTSPNGRVVGALENGRSVTIIDRTFDRQRRPWVYVADAHDGQPLGWAFREFV